MVECFEDMVRRKEQLEDLKKTDHEGVASSPTWEGSAASARPRGKGPGATTLVSGRVQAPGPDGRRMGRTGGEIPSPRTSRGRQVGDTPKSALDWINWGREQKKKKASMNILISFM